MYYKRLAYKENMNLLNNFWKRRIFSEFAALSLSRRWQHWSNRLLVTKVEQTQRSEVWRNYLPLVFVLALSTCTNST